MKTPEQENSEFEIPLIGRLIDVRLKARLQDEHSSAALIAHPDDDVIAAFLEGRLQDIESRSLISHLVSCIECLHLTAALVRSEPDLNEVGSASIPEDPGPLRRFLDRVADGVISAGEDAVFAYEEKEEEGADDEPEAKSDSQT